MLEMKKDEETQKLVLDEETCIEIAMKVYEVYTEEMKPPLYIFQTFPDWLERRRGS